MSQPSLQSYPVPARERERLEALKAYGVLDTPPEAEFDHIVRLASELFQVPIALVSLVDDKRQFFKARVGLDACETSRDVSFCTYALAASDVVVVLDATQDARFAANVLVTGEPGIRFYAGAPLAGVDGHVLGALCIIDVKPRPALTREQISLLKNLAQIVMHHLERKRLENMKRGTMLMTQAMSDAIVCVDDANAISFWNRAAEQMLGHAREAAVGCSLDLIIPPQVQTAHDLAVGVLGEGNLSQIVAQPVRMSAIRQDGTELPIELTRASWDDDGRLQTVFIIRDISERRRAEERLKQLALFDPVSGLANRAHFQDALESPGAAPFAVVLVGLDRFKAVNASLGPSAGDDLLRQISKRLGVLLDGQGLFARIGGDEFALLVRGCADPLGAESIAGAMLAAFAQPFTVHGRHVHIGASAGIALDTGPLDSIGDGALASAGLALHWAKAQGRGRVELYRSTMRRDASERRELEEELRRAHDRNEFELFYQPQITLVDGRVRGAEALLRWRHPGRGRLAPAAFLSVLESSQVAVAVGEWAIEQACGFARSLANDGLIIRVGVNLFAAQFRGGDLVACVEGSLARHGLPPACLELEITETTALTAEESMLAPLRRLRALGIGLAFDDYGTGYASLSLLKKYPLTRLKIDREFIRDLGADPDDEAIVRAVLAMSESLGLHVTAEGIETQEQATFLRLHGCGEAQGNLFGKPMPARQFTELFRAGVSCARAQAEAA